MINGAETITTGSGETPAATTGGSLVGAEATPKPQLGGVFGGISGFFESIKTNPILLLIAVVILVFVIGKMF